MENTFIVGTIKRACQSCTATDLLYKGIQPPGFSEIKKQLHLYRHLNAFAGHVLKYLLVTRQS